MNTDQPVVAVPEFDLERYTGLWYEIGRLPLGSEPDDAADVTAEYTIAPDGSVTVDNRCRTRTRVQQSVGRAEPVPGEPGKLTVTFLPRALQWIPFTKGDYWVLALEDDYSIALVGDPDRKHLWLLSRTPQLNADDAERFLDEARMQGFDLGDWIRTPQSGEPVTDDELRDDDDFAADVELPGAAGPRGGEIA